jgi:uncharacterized SAM-dependent methyltransferase
LIRSGSTLFLRFGDVYGARVIAIEAPDTSRNTVPLKKESGVLDTAYNDANGVTADFNLNLLHRINRE